MPHHALFVLDMEPRALCIPGKRSANQAMPPALCISNWDGRILSYLIWPSLVAGTMARESHFNGSLPQPVLSCKRKPWHADAPLRATVWEDGKAHSRYLGLSIVFSVPGTSLKFPEERNGSPSLGYPPESTA